MLKRNLLYTAVTRGKKLVVLVGSTKALQAALSHGRDRRRYTRLARRLAWLKREMKNMTAEE
jgi:exodeoxyribonuclease V alpha subunit